MSDSGVDVGVGEESSGQVKEKLNNKVLPHLQCSKCQGFFRGQVFGCSNNHATCSLCCGVDIESGMGEDVDGQDEEGMEVDNKEENDDKNKLADVVCPMEDCKSKTSINIVGKNLTRMVRDLRLNVPCKNRDAGCTHKCVEDEIEEHEDECEDRKVRCDFCDEFVPFKDLLHHLKDEYEVDYDAKKWILDGEVKPTGGDEPIGYKDAFMIENGPDGLVFLTDVIRDKNGILDDGHFHIVVRVMGGKQVAKKYRVELRVSSNKSSVSLTHSGGPVFPIDYSKIDATDVKESFEISCPKFAFFNHGKEYFGKHNEDKNGEIVLPVSVKIEKKKLGVSTD